MQSGWKNWKSGWSVVRQKNELEDQGEGVQDSGKTRGQDYKEKHKTRLQTNVKRTVLNNTKLRHF